MIIVVIVLRKSLKLGWDDRGTVNMFLTPLEIWRCSVKNLYLADNPFSGQGWKKGGVARSVLLSILAFLPFLLLSDCFLCVLCLAPDLNHSGPVFDKNSKFF